VYIKKLKNKTGFLKMLKKFLIFSLILHNSYILSSHSPHNLQYDIAFSTICTVAGMMCAWRSYEDFKKGLLVLEQRNRELQFLKDMGVKVYKVSKNEFKSDILSGHYIQVQENYRMDIPLSCSQEEVNQAKEHWNLFLTYEKDVSNPVIWPVVGSLILLPTGIGSLLKLLA